MRNISELGIQAITDYGAGKLLDSDVERFESKFGLPLPPDYVFFLGVCNGGFPRLARRFRSAEGEEWAINEFYFLAPKRKLSKADVGFAANAGIDFGNLWDEMQVAKDRIGNAFVPIAGDSFGDQIVLDYRSLPPSICVIAHEQNDRIIPIACDFTTFIDSLY